MAAPLVLQLSVLCFVLAFTCCAGECEIETGESVIIMDISESRGNQINQSTVPEELPIRGHVPAIELKIQTTTEDFFSLFGKSLRLKRPIDRDSGSLNLVRLQVLCRHTASGIQRNIPVVVRIGDINDNPPVFKSQSYETMISEMTPVGTTIFRDLSATDRDSESNGLVEFTTARGDGTEMDGFPYFEINLPFQGLVSVKKALDYERTKVYYLKILATDRPTDPSQRLTATTTLTVHVADGDDQDPVFVQKSCTLVNGVCINVEYTADVTSGLNHGLLEIKPEPIRAKDRDSLDSPIRYSFVNGTPSFYEEYFKIDPENGQVRQLQALYRNQTKHLELIIKAEEMTDAKRLATAKLLIDVQPVDNNPPVIMPNAFEGFVEENSPIGTTVSIEKDKQTPLRLVVYDADIETGDPPEKYSFELTSHSFRVNSEGFLVVNDPKLDRDPPNPSKYTFQVIARQLNSAPGKGASAPVTLNVNLKDINDNSPRLPLFAPMRMLAGDGIRTVTKVEATDSDEGEMADVTYSIYHVSNNGGKKFRIDRKTGIVEAIEKLTAGEQYSITVQATDGGGRFTQAILDVMVDPGPNTGGPTFSRDRYDAQVSEGAAVNSSIVTVKAEDPEGDDIKYSIADGNINSDFWIDEKSGVIYVANRLDREEISTYSLTVKATDPSGLFSTATVAVTVTDINDQNPVFDRSSYIFKVDEGISNTKVGSVQAHDDDIGDNGEVTYSISGNGFSLAQNRDFLTIWDKFLKAPQVTAWKRVLAMRKVLRNPIVWLRYRRGRLSVLDHAKDFTIDQKTGDISTTRALDFERQQIHYLVVSARDQAPDARFATATVTVYVNDIQDEKPVFEKEVYEANVPENVANYDVVQVKATDPDSVSTITYVIQEGNTTIFTIDSASGMVRTAMPLDYEQQSSHTLVIGTLENENTNPRATTVIVVNVIDANDVSPVFTSVPLPIRVQDTVPLGTVVTTVVATDADGTPPGSEIYYEITGQAKAPDYFLIDRTSGLITVKDDLRKEADSEYKIEVTAKDFGSPPLSATATVTVFVEHIATVAPDSGLGFADSHYNVEVEENSLANTLIKTLPVINKPRGSFPIGCRIDSGNELGYFYVIENNQRDCELRLQSASLDYEQQSRFLLSVRLVTVGGLFGSSRLTTDVVVSVVDVNDNRPEFIIPQRYSRLIGNRYLSALPHDSAIGTSFLQIRAEDRDSGANGFVTYEIASESDLYRRFRIDPTTGFLSNSKSLDDVSPEELPLRLKVVARDNPELRSAMMMQSTEVLVNVIRDENRMVMVLKDALPDSVLSMKEKILSVIQARTGIIADAEKVVSLKTLKNYTIETDTSGSDFWFYAIDPGTFRILSTEDPKLKSSILSRSMAPGILQEVSRTLGVNAVQIRPPVLVPAPTPTVIDLPTVVVVKPAGTRPSGTDGDVSVLGAALIALASIIVILGFVGIVYHCCMWSKYVTHRERMKRLYLAPRYEPVFVEPSLKEYETQVLQMSVPIDEEGSLSDPHLSLTLRGMEGISYIRGRSPDRNRDGTASAFGGSRNPDHSFSTTAESLNDSRSSIGHSTARAASSLSATASGLEEQGLMLPATNPLFQDDEQDGDVPDEGKSSSTDSNVAMVETHHTLEPPRTVYKVESTTEL